MKRGHIVSAVAVALCLSGLLMAQQNPGTIAALEFQKLKSGMVQQYEAARKTKAAWHKQQNDPLPLFVWEVLSGDNTGDYIVGRVGQHWADMDKPAVSDESDKAEFQKVVASAVESIVTRYYEYMPKISNGDTTGPAKFSEILIFETKYGREADFQSAISRIHDAGQKTNWPVKYEWYALDNGGSSGEFVLVLPHNNWADFDDKPDVKPFREMIKDAFGQNEADSIINRIDNSVIRETTEIIQFRPDLSYMPGK
jgi:hypothetical protein